MTALRKYKPTEKQMYPSGIVIDLLNPKIEDIDWRDIAHGLSLQCRFVGGVKFFYSVASHSCWCADYIDDKQYALHGLLHDAHEAYTGDNITPLKSAIETRVGVDPLKPIQDNLDRLIFEKAGLDFVEYHNGGASKRAVKRVDMLALSTECYFLRPGIQNFTGVAPRTTGNTFSAHDCPADDFLAMLESLGVDISESV